MMRLKKRLILYLRGMALATYYQNLCDEDTKLIGSFSRKDMELIEASRRDWRLFDSGGYEAKYRRASRQDKRSACM